MRVVVDYDRCESNGICMMEAPEVFELREDDNLYLLEEHPGPGLRSKVESAVAGCPTAAISIEED
jgi:ferredoxin